MYGGLFAALLIAFFFTMIVLLIFQRKRTGGTAWTFFLVMFLALWTVSFYVRAAGPLYWGIAWLPLVFAGLLLTTLLLTIVPVVESNKNIVRDTDSSRLNIRHQHQIHGVEKLFWILIALLIMAILIGMVNPNAAR